MSGVLERLFHLRERGTTAVAELRGGAVTFATMSYIIFVQPALLSQAAGMDFGAVMTATCVSAALATLVMGLWRLRADRRSRLAGGPRRPGRSRGHGSPLRAG